jgi:molybdopterin converting factor small subunit
MPIRIVFAAQFAELVGGADSVTVAGHSVGEVLRRLTERHPALATLVWSRTAVGARELNPAIVVFLNGEDTRARGGLDALLNEGDELLLISAVEGG